MANNTENLDSLKSNPYIAKDSSKDSGKDSRCATCGANLNQSANLGANQSANFGANQNTNTQNTTSAISSFLNSGNSQTDFLKGAFIGVVATFILTNKDAQSAIFKGFAKISNLFEMGLEELKERYEDAKAEVDSE